MSRVGFVIQASDEADPTIAQAMRAAVGMLTVGLPVRVLLGGVVDVTALPPDSMRARATLLALGHEVVLARLDLVEDVLALLADCDTVQVWGRAV